MAEIVAELDRSTVPPDGGSVRAAIGIQPGIQEDEVERHIAICVDTSGSMSGEKIAKVREGILWVFGYLEDADYISVVSFDDDVEVILPPSRWGDLDREEAEEAVGDISAGGGTDIEAGLARAHETLTGLPTGEDIGRRILLLSDGRDRTPVERFEEMARLMRREDDIAIPAAGIGDFYDEDIIRAIGTASEGEWIHLSEAADIEDFFGRKVEGLSTVVAPNPHLRLDLYPGTGIDEVFLREPQVQDVSYDRDGDTVRIYLPDLLELETQEIVMRLDTPPLSAGDRVALADVILRSRTEMGETSIVVGCSADEAALGDVDTRVGVKHLDTMVRKAAGDGDVEAAETLIEQATRIDSAGVDDMQTVLDDEEGVDDMQTVLVDEAAVDDMQTVVETARDGDVEEQYLTTKLRDPE